MKLKVLLIAGLATIGLAFSANAGVIVDTDTDLIPDVLDNCPNDANGPGNAPNNQVDTNGDGFGNRCDADYDGLDATVDFDDFNAFLGAFGGPAGNDFDHDFINATIDFGDFDIFLALFGGPPGNQ